MNSNHEKYMKRGYELAISAGKKGYDIFGGVLQGKNTNLVEV